MLEVVSSVQSIFEKLIKEPGKAEEFALELRDKLNDILNNERNFKMVECKKVYVSTMNGSDPFYAIVIPETHRSGNIIDVDAIYSYYVDLDMSNIITAYNKYGLTAAELTAWFMHELYANVITDTTLCRYKKLFISHYDMQNKAIVAAHNDLGTLTWFGVFGNTEKVKITDTTSDAVSTLLKNDDLSEYWNLALDKYVASCGGDYDIIMPNRLAEDDRACLEQFNKLGRKYYSYTVKYVNPDWSTLTRYLSAKIGSEALKDAIAKEPEHIAAIPEKDVYNAFDSRKLLREETERAYDELTAGTPDTRTDIEKEMSINDLISSVDELTLDVDNVYCGSDKLRAAAKLKDLLRSVEKRISEDSLNESLLELKERIYQLSRKLANVNVEEISVLEIK